MDYWILHTKDFFARDHFWPWLAMIAIVMLATLIAKLALRFIAGRMRRITEKTVSTWDDVGVEIVASCKSVVIFVVLYYILTKPLKAPDFVDRALLVSVVIVSIYQIAIWGLLVLRNWQGTVLRSRVQNDPSSSAALGLLYTAVQVVFLTVVVLIGLSTLGINISALLAGLGVGGIAVALAAQNILGDLLASLSIVLDKPFVVGDFIVTGSDRGTVEHIGIKTTRLRSISGEELILSNKDLLESRVQNYKRMWRRRVVQKFGVVYSTPAEVLEKIPEWVKSAVHSHKKLAFDRCHFMAYGESSLDFELVFFVDDPEYNVFMDLQQLVLLELIRKFAVEGVDFAFPSRTIYLDKIPPLKIQSPPVEA